MIRVEQTILTPPNGNCHQACLASILELPLEHALTSITPPHEAEGREATLAAELAALGMSRMFVESSIDTGLWPDAWADTIAGGTRSPAAATRNPAGTSR